MRPVCYLCEITGVSRSGFYHYFSEEAIQYRRKQNEADEGVKEIILKAYHF